MANALIIASTILVLISPIIYIRSIWKGETKPHRTTRIVYLVISLLSTYALYRQWDNVGLWLSAATLLQSLAVFAMSMRHGVGGRSKTDITCLVIAGIGIIVWQITKNPLTGLAASILADLAGTRPTVTKTRKRPESETRLYYGIDMVAWGLSLLALSSWTVAWTAYPGYIFIINLIVMALCLRKRSTTTPAPLT